MRLTRRGVLVLCSLGLVLGACAEPAVSALSGPPPAIDGFATRTVTVTNEVRGLPLDAVLAPWDSTSNATSPVDLVQVVPTQVANVRFTYAEQFEGSRSAVAEATAVEWDALGYATLCIVNVDPHRLDLPLLTHELGHCLGLHHDPAIKKGEASNLYPRAKWYQQGWSDTVTPRDLRHLSELYAGRPA